jgi:hypothetical protein
MNNAHDEKISFCPASAGSVAHVSRGLRRIRARGCRYRQDRSLLLDVLHDNVSISDCDSNRIVRTQKVQRRAHQTRRHFGAT